MKKANTLLFSKDGAEILKENIGQNNLFCLLRSHWLCISIKKKPPSETQISKVPTGKRSRTMPFP